MWNYFDVFVGRNWKWYIFVMLVCLTLKVGRLPMEWAKSVIPLVQSGNVKVRGRCIATPYKLEMMQEIMLLVRYKFLVYFVSLVGMISMKAFTFIWFFVFFWIFHLNFVSEFMTKLKCIPLSAFCMVKWNKLLRNLRI